MTRSFLLRVGGVSAITAASALILGSCTSGGPAEDGPGTLTPGGGSSQPGGTAQGGNVTANGGATGSVPVTPGGGSTSAGASGVSSTETGGGNGPSSAGNPGSSAGGATTGPICSDTPPNNGDTCAHAVEFGWCSQSWLGDSCQTSCGKCKGSNSSGGATGSAGSNGSAGSTSSGSAGSGATGGMPRPPLQGASQGWMSRYWDCCKPACAWSGNAPGGHAMPTCSSGTQRTGADASSACGGGSAYMCYDFQPWAVDSYLSYGFVAASGSNYQCGACYEFQFDGSSHTGSTANGAKSKSMIVQVINNGGVQSNQFDLLLAGGGVGEFDACSKEWNASSSDLGSRYGGLLDACNGDLNCFNNKAKTLFGNKPGLMAGATWFATWFGIAGNPNMVYKKVSCPAALTAKSGMSG